jgi:carboxyl-terminal processing protease
MRIFKIFLLLVISSHLVFTQNKDEEYYKKLNKSFEIYGAVFKILTKDYVVAIDPQELMEKGIEGMLDALDPYTVYLPEEKNNNRLDALMSGAYIGFGISAGTVDSQLTVLNILPNSPNRKFGLRVGDRIYKIDTTVLLYSQSSELQKYSSGKPGTFIDVEILRDGIDDTLKLKLLRDKIRINGISFYRMLDGGIGYIYISEFTRNLSDEFKTSLFELKQQGKLKGLIIDVRDNPGGLLLSAVEICELFLPDDTPVVSTKGNNSNDFNVIKTVSTAADTSLPLAILINGNSASASEILAAAFQDLDRAVIIGERSYGKGLVQSVKELPYNGYLKLTTSKYYMPSGRCIQRLDYPIAKEEDGLGLHHDSLFHTKNNRPVYESAGVEPDIEVQEKDLNDYQKSLLSQHCFFKFANLYSSAFDTLQLDFSVDDDVLNQFEEFLRDSGDCQYENSLSNRLNALKKEIEKTPFNKSISKDIARIIKKVEKAGDYQFQANIDFIKDYLGAEILQRFYSVEKIGNKMLDKDITVKKAVSVLKSQQYYTILSKPENKLN